MPVRPFYYLHLHADLDLLNLHADLAAFKKLILTGPIQRFACKSHTTCIFYQLVCQHSIPSLRYLSKQSRVLSILVSKQTYNHGLWANMQHFEGSIHIYISIILLTFDHLSAILHSTILGYTAKITVAPALANSSPNFWRNMWTLPKSSSRSLFSKPYLLVSSSIY